MTPRAAQLLDGADRAIAAAQRELEANEIETAAERACVAMLHLAKACLDVDGLSPGPTQAVCVAYGERFGRTARLYSAYHRWLLDAVDLRKASTGELAGPIDRAAAATAVERAELFRDAVYRFVERNG
ncbi:MAG: DNA-binding protein [Candidatus Limnocylindrales bacterium]